MTTLNAPRAVVWLAWGEKYVAEAAKSRETMRSLEYPALLITEADTADFARQTGAFDQVIVAPFEQSGPGNQRKSEMWRWLPEGIDTFLFLDTDTRVLGDIGLGFEKAERYGIAMVPAAHYCLDHFWGFHEVMEEEGIEPQGQLQYNSGVIFFTRTPEVQEVFAKWGALTKKHGGRWDQSFLTLAMELLDVRPYALSPNYNYRGMGVPIVGEVRIWHTPHEPPEGLNDQPGRWPMRYFVDGKLHHPGTPYRKTRRFLKRLVQGTPVERVVRRVKTLFL